MNSPAAPSRSEALDHMTRALEAAKRARDSGQNVSDARASLKQSRAAFMAGDYARAMQIADQILERFQGGSASRPPMPDWAVVASRIREARRSAKKAKRYGFNTPQINDLITRSLAAYRAGDYATALTLADEAIRLSGFPPR